LPQVNDSLRGKVHLLQQARLTGFTDRCPHRATTRSVGGPMTPLATGAAIKTAMALTAATATTVLFAGTAAAACPALAATPTETAATQQVSEFPLWDPHGRAFRVHFRTYGECVFFANHDRNPRTHGWDCRRGGDRD